MMVVELRALIVDCVLMVLIFVFCDGFFMYVDRPSIPKSSISLRTRVLIDADALCI